MGCLVQRLARCFVCFFLGMVGSLASPAWAFEFSAERIFRDHGKVVNAHVNARTDRWRLEFAEPQAGAMAAIIRLDRHVAWLILSKRRMFLEVPIGPEHLLLVSEKMDGEVARELIGTEIMHGFSTDFFEVTVLMEGEPVQYYQWVTQAHRFPIKTARKRGDWSVEYRHVVFTKQSSLFFEPPRGYAQANAPNLRGGPSQGR
jgi:hypothetical protein